MRHFGALLEDVADSFFDFDNRLLRTLPALYFRPGFLTREYFAGRRVRYLPPFRTTFLLSVLAFLIIQFGIDSSQLNVHVAEGNAFAVATTPDQVQQMLNKQLQSLNQASAQGGSVASAGIDVARAELRRQAAVRTRQIEAGDISGPSAAEVAGGTVELAQWPERIAAATSLPSVEHRTAQAVAAIQAERKAGSVTPARASALDALDREVYETAGQRVAQLASLQDQEAPTAATGETGLVGRVEQYYLTRAKRNLVQLRDDPQARQLLVAAMFNILPPVLLAMLPLFALLLKALYLFKRRLYVEHLVVALHSHAFLFLSAMLLALVYQARTNLAPAAAWTQAPLLGLLWILWLWIPVYLLWMQKRVYGQGWVMTVCKFSLAGLVYVWLLTLALLGVVVLALGSM